ncbi:MAG: LOG family protein [Candidatus Saccharimonadales bacterium]
MNKTKIIKKASFRVAITLTSSLHVDKKYLELTRQVATALAVNNIGIVYGGTAYGMMLELAKSYKDGRGTDLVGVMAKDLMKVTKGYVAFSGLDEQYLMPTMEERKSTIIEKADAFLILPGGYGTVEEIGTILGGRVNKLFDKPIAFFNLDGFYDDLFSFFHCLKKQKFSKIDFRDACIVSESMDEILSYYRDYKKSELVDKFI